MKINNIVMILLVSAVCAACGPAERAKTQKAVGQPMTEWEQGVAECEAQDGPYSQQCLELFIAQYQTKYGLY